MKEEEKLIYITDKLFRAKSTLSEAEHLMSKNFFNAAVNIIYYACFYAVTALLINDEIKARKHSGVIQMFGLHFISQGIISKETGKFYTEIFDIRMSGDYQDLIYFTEDEVRLLLMPARQLITEIENVILNRRNGNL